jgi:hypothetical protein
MPTPLRLGGKPALSRNQAHYIRAASHSARVDSVKDADGEVIREAPLAVWQRALDTTIKEINAKTDLNVAIESIERAAHRRANCVDFCHQSSNGIKRKACWLKPKPRWTVLLAVGVGHSRAVFPDPVEVQAAFSHRYWFLVGEILHSFCRMSSIMTTAAKNKVGRKSLRKQTVTLLSFGLELCVSPNSWRACSE